MHGVFSFSFHLIIQIPVRENNLSLPALLTINYANYLNNTDMTLLKCGGFSTLSKFLSQDVHYHHSNNIWGFLDAEKFSKISTTRKIHHFRGNCPSFAKISMQKPGLTFA